jgi:hypothetical protein
VLVEFEGTTAQHVIDRLANGEDVPFVELRHILDRCGRLDTRPVLSRLYQFCLAAARSDWATGAELAGRHHCLRYPGFRCKRRCNHPIR